MHLLDPKTHLTGGIADGRGRFPELPIHTLDQKRGLHLVVLYVVIDHQRFPWAFTVWQGKDTTSPAQLALRMLKRLPAQFKTLFQPRVLADDGFGSDEFLEGCVALGLPAVTGRGITQTATPNPYPPPQAVDARAPVPTPAIALCGETRA